MFIPPGSFLNPFSAHSFFLQDHWLQILASFSFYHSNYHSFHLLWKCGGDARSGSHRFLKQTAKCKSVFQILHPFLTVPKSRTQTSPFGFKGIESRYSDPNKCPQITVMERSCSNFVSYLLLPISVFVNDVRETAQFKKNGQNTKS